MLTLSVVRICSRTQLVREDVGTYVDTKWCYVRSGAACWRICWLQRTLGRTLYGLGGYTEHAKRKTVKAMAIKPYTEARTVGTL